MTIRAVVYGTLAAWTVGVIVATIYVLPDAPDETIRTVKAGLIVWVAGVAVLGGFLAWRDREFFAN